MKHSCGTVALDGLKTRPKKKMAESYGSAATQNKTQLQVNRVEPPLQYTKLFKQKT